MIDIIRELLDQSPHSTVWTISTNYFHRVYHVAHVLYYAFSNFHNTLCNLTYAYGNHGRDGQPWWRHQMETFSASLAICAGNSPGEFPAQRPVMRSFDVFFDLRLNQRLSKQSWGWWFKTLSRPLWRQCNAYTCPVDTTVACHYFYYHFHVSHEWNTKMIVTSDCHGGGHWQNTHLCSLPIEYRGKYH